MSQEHVCKLNYWFLSLNIKKILAKSFALEPFLFSKFRLNRTYKISCFAYFEKNIIFEYFRSYLITSGTKAQVSCKGIWYSFFFIYFVFARNSSRYDTGVDILCIYERRKVRKCKKDYNLTLKKNLDKKWI